MQIQPGTLSLFILRALVTGRRHGFDIVTWLRHLSEGDLSVEEGAVYHALRRMERNGWLASEWGTSDNNRQAKYYRLTPLGRLELQTQETAWKRYAAIVGRALRPARRRS